MHNTLKNLFGYDNFRPGQEQPIRDLLAGEDVFCVMPTGAGKSLIFQIPALMGAGLTIVVSPLIALMNDQVSALKLLGAPAETLNSTVAPEDNERIWHSVRSGETKLLYMSPERLMNGGTLEVMRSLNVTMIAVDEAHCISQWGPSFRPEYEMLTELKTHFPDAPIIALTASADEVTRKDIAQKLFSGNAKIYVSGFDRPNISLAVTPKQSWKNQLAAFVKTRKGDSGIIYCLSRKKCEDAATTLNSLGHTALVYHAGMDKFARDDNQKRFVRDPSIIMCATIAFGMGIDKPNVRFVFHTDLPSSMENYYQEFGRAGRDGDAADCEMLFGMGDIRMRRQFIEQDDASTKLKRRAHKRLDRLIAYCEAPTCRRQALLSYFGEASEPCNNCDVCLDPIELKKGTREGQMVLSAIVRTGQRFGPAYICDILTGANTERIRDFGHDKLPTWGVGKHLKKPQWQSIIRQMVASGFVHLDVAEYGGISMTAQGKNLLRGAAEFSYRPQPSKMSVGKTAKIPRGAKAKQAEQSLSEAESELLTRLKAARSSLAQKQNVPAFMIFHDKSLRDMARQRPKNISEMANVHGVGKAKLERFGGVFLAVLHPELTPD
ncbi:MAG: DNA helicase RecQ [Robiginitomaculum sp.]|nr:DNA helicase RecQ [Robiginitomaculum sp.]